MATAKLNGQTEEKITALYCRLSVDDDNKDEESNSITNQKQILSDYAKKNGYANTMFFVDDGISGTTFQRPNFMRMERMAENGEIGTIIVKDLSRFGREQVEMPVFIFRGKVAVLGEDKERQKPDRGILHLEHLRHPPQRMKQLHCCTVRQFHITQNQFYFLILKNPALSVCNRGNQNQVKALLQHSSPQHSGAGIFRMDKEQLVKSQCYTNVRGAFDFDRKTG